MQSLPLLLLATFLTACAARAPAPGPGAGGTAGEEETGGTGGADAGAPPDLAPPRDAPVAPPDAGKPDDAPAGEPTAPDAAPGDTGATTPTTSAACLRPHPVPPEGFHDLLVGAETRKFILRLPAAYDGKKPWPVIFVFHGAGQSAGYFDGNTDLRRETEEKAILVLPDGPIKPDGRRSWVFRSADNVLFTDALVAWLKENTCINPSRLFATGLSSGGYMSLTLACQRGDVFRAVASCSGGMVETGNCRGNPTVWLRAGQADTAGTRDSLTMARDFWLGDKGCGKQGMPVAGVPCTSYPGCEGATPVVFCSDPGGHGWPAYFSKAIWGAFSQP